MSEQARPRRVVQDPPAQATTNRGMDANPTARHPGLTMRTILAACALLIAAGAAGCTSEPERPPAGATVPTASLDASVAQFRFDEGTKNLRAGVTNNSDPD